MEHFLIKTNWARNFRSCPMLRGLIYAEKEEENHAAVREYAYASMR